MNFSNLIRLHWAALRALLVLTVITGIAYPLVVWAVAQVPGLRDKAEGSIVDGRRKAGRQRADRPVVHRRRRQRAAAVLPEPAVGRRRRLRPDGHQRVQPRPGEHRRHPRRSRRCPRTANGYKASLLTLVCSRSKAIGDLEGRRRVAAVLHRRRRRCGAVGDRPARLPGQRGAPDPGGQRQRAVRHHQRPFLDTYEGVRVECATFGEDYSIGQIVPIRGAAPAEPAVPADAVTASGSGLDPDISIGYADLQIARVAKARGVSADQIRQVVAANTSRPHARLPRRTAGQRARAEPGSGSEVPDQELIDRWMMVR